MVKLIRKFSPFPYSVKFYNTIPRVPMSCCEDTYRNLKTIFFTSSTADSPRSRLDRFEFRQRAESRRRRRQVARHHRRRNGRRQKLRDGGENRRIDFRLRAGLHRHDEGLAPVGRRQRGRPSQDLRRDFFGLDEASRARG